MAVEQTVRKLQQKLDRASTPETKAWFENYLKHVIEYRGVKSPVVSTLVREWRIEEKLTELSTHQQLKIASSLIAEPKAEDKFAGIFYLQKFLVKELPTDKLLRSAESLFRKGAFYDWSTTDWFCMRVLSSVVLRDFEDGAKRIAGWQKSKNLWQRRCSLVPFLGATKHRKYHPLIKATISNLVQEDERFIQTAVGWVLSDLSKVFPEIAEKLIEKHFQNLSIEVIRRHTKHLPNHKKYIARKSKTSSSSC